MKEVTLPQLLSVENGKLPHRTWQECATHRGNSRVAKKRTFNSAKEEKVLNVCSKEEIYRENSMLLENVAQETDMPTQISHRHRAPVRVHT